MVPLPVPVYQMVMRSGCSLFLYHMVVMTIRDGAIALSKPPSRKRTAISAP